MAKTKAIEYYAKKAKMLAQESIDYERENVVKYYSQKAKALAQESIDYERQVKDSAQKREIKKLASTYGFTESNIANASPFVQQKITTSENKKNTNITPRYKTAKETKEAIENLNKDIATNGMAFPAIEHGEAYQSFLKARSEYTKEYKKEKKTLTDEYNFLKDKEDEAKTKDLPEDLLELLDEYNRGHIDTTYNPFSYARSQDGYKYFGKELKYDGYTEKELKELAAARKRKTDEIDTIKALQEAYELSKESPVQGSIGSLVDNFAGGATGLFDLAGQYIKDPDRDFNVNTMSLRKSQTANAARSAVSEDIETPLLRKLYDVGMSIGDMVTASAGTLGYGTLPMFFAEAGVQNAIDLTERGTDSSTALAGGLAAGTFEVLFEKLSLGNLKALSRMNTSTLKGFGKEFAKTVGVNASEEAATEATNILYDTLANGDISNYSLRKEQIMAEGKTEEEAKTEIFNEFLSQIGDAALSGGLMGGMLAPAGIAVGNYRYSKQGKNLSEGQTEALKDYSSTSGGEAGRLYKEYQSKYSDKNAALGMMKEAADNEVISNLIESESLNDITEAYDNAVKLNTDEGTRRILDNVYNARVSQIFNKETAGETNAVVNSNGHTIGVNRSEEIRGGRNYTLSKDDVEVIKRTAGAKLQDGSEVIINGITDDNGELKYKTIEGKAVAPSEVTFNNDTTRELYQKAAEIEEPARNLFINTYPGDVSVGKFKNGFENFYDSGKLSGAVSFDMAKEMNSAFLENVINESAARKAYEAGQASITGNVNINDSLIRKSTAGTVVDNTVVNHLDEGVKELIGSIAKKTGIDFELTDEIIAGETARGERVYANGYFDKAVVKAVISGDADNAAEAAAHETTHFAFALNNKDMKKVSDLCIAYLAETSDAKTAEALIENKMKNVETREDAIEELTSDAIAGIISSEEGAKAFIEYLETDKNLTTAEKRTILEKIKDLIERVLESIKALAGQGHISDTAKVFAEAEYDRVSEILNLYTKALDKASEKLRKGERAEEGAGKVNTKFSLKNKNITEDTKIPFVIAEEYIDVPKNNKAALSELQNKVKQLPRSTYENKATGYRADITEETIKKAINPTHKNFNKHSSKYINNLNATLNFSELFENAVYIDTIENQKSKNANKNIKGFHHFVAPLRMKGADYRTLITAREKKNSNTLYVLGVEVLPMKKKMSQSATSLSGSRSKETSSMITIPDLIRDVKIYNYDTQENQTYTQENIKFSFIGEKALNKNNKSLEKAKEMESAGKTSEDIRKNTGWFRGGDNKWRFEIDSSKMRVDHRGKFHRNSAIRRRWELFDKLHVTNTATKADFQELMQLDRTLGTLTEPKKLGDLIDYPQLFEAYPQLADMDFSFVNLGDMDGGYSPLVNKIFIDESLKEDSQQMRQTLIHEIQHAIQEAEGFAKGSNLIGLNKAIEEAKRIEEKTDKQLDVAIDELFRLLDESGYIEQYGEDIDVLAEKEQDRIRAFFKENNKDGAEALEKVIKLWEENTRAITETARLQKISSHDYYMNSAGEIEARDVSNRLYFTEEQIRNIRPDIDNDAAIVRFSLKNKNITEDTKIPFVIAEEYIDVPKNNKAALSELQNKVKQLPRGTYENKATGYKANINSNTIKKALTPTHKKFNWFSEEYINNLNGILRLSELFKTAIYVDTISPMKNKKDNPNMKGFHHFVAPLGMKGGAYRALITAREKENSNTLYVLRVEVLPIEKTPLLTASSIGSQSVRAFSEISIPDLIRDVKIYNYDTQESQIYTQEDIKYSLLDSSGRKLTKKQAEYFKGSKARDDNGNLQIVYHGTNEAGFTVFNRNINFYSDSKELAKTYSNTNGLYEGYANIKNPLVIDVKGEKWSGIPVEYIELENIEDIFNEYGVDTFEDGGMERTSTADIASAIDEAVEEGQLNYDGIIFKNIYDEGSYSSGIGIILANDYVTFNKNQFKNITNENPTDDPDIRFSLKNKNITEDTKIPFVIAERYVDVPKNNKAALRELQNRVKEIPRGTYENKATGYRAGINGKTIGKILNPKPNFNPWGKNYIDNLNAALYLPNLFKNAVYIDTIENQKSKNANKQIRGFHHFIAPITMKDNNYRVKITAREKENSNLLYIVDTEILQNKEDVALPNNMNGNFLTTSFKISIPDLIKDVKIYNYDMQENQTYTYEDIKFSIKENATKAGELLEENRKLKRINENLIAQFKITDGMKIRNNIIEGIAQSLLEDYDSEYTIDALKNDLMALYNYIETAENLTIQDIAAGARIVGERIVENRNKKGITDETKEILEDIRTVKITLDDVQKKETAYHFGSYDNFRRKNFGKLRVTDNGTALDTKWQEWAVAYPQHFDPNISPADQPIKLNDIVESLSESYIDTLGMNEDEAAIMVGLDVYERYFDVPSVKTFADKKKAEMDKLKAETKVLIRSVKEEYRDKTKKWAADRRETELKQSYKRRITTVVRRLNSTMEANSYSKNIPDAMKGAVSEFIKPFLNDKEVFEEGRSARLADMYNRIGERMKDAEGNEASKDDTYVDFISAYDKDIEDSIKTFKEVLKDKTLNDLNSSELSIIKDTLDNLSKMLETANTVFIAGKKAKLAEVGDATIAEHTKEKVKERLAITENQYYKTVKSFADSNITPGYFFKRLGGAFSDLYNDFLDGQDKYANIMQNSREKFKEIAEKNGYYNWDKKQRIKIEIGGDEHEVTLEQLMLLYATGRREQENGMESMHIFSGGVTFRNAKKTKEKKIGPINGKIKYTDKQTGIPITFDEYIEACGKLTEKQINFTDELVKYLSEDMASYGNQVTREMYGISKFNEKYYIPFNSDSNFIYSNSGGTQGLENRLKHASYTKNLTYGANNPLILDDITDVWSAHVAQMAMYSSLMRPIEELNKVLNYKNENGITVKAQLNATYTGDTVNYIQTFMRDVNGGLSLPKEEQVMKKLTTQFKKAATYASMSVAVQQPTSILRAMCMINPKYFAGRKIEAPKKEKRLQTSSSADYEQLKRYAPIAIIKQMGRFDTMVGMTSKDYLTRREYETVKGNVKNIATDKQMLQDILGYGASKGDEIGWASLWNACKRETADRTKLKGEALLQEAGKRFREVANLTQVYDSVLSKSQLMRQKTWGVSMITAFMAEPTISLNMLIDGVMDAKKTKKAKYATKTLAAFLTSQLAAAILKSFVTAARDDDEDKTYWERFFGKAVGESWGNINPLSLVPMARDINSLFEGYSVERADVEVISKLVDAAKKIYDTDTPIGEKISNMIFAVGDFVGVPARNIWRDFRAIGNVVSEAADPNRKETTAYGIEESVLEELGMKKSYTDYAEDLYKVVDKDYDGQKKILEELSESYKREIENGGDADKVRSKVRGAITRYLKPKYQEADNSEKIKIKKLLFRIRIGGKAIYDNEDIKKWNEE